MKYAWVCLIFFGMLGACQQSEGGKEKRVAAKVAALPVVDTSLFETFEYQKEDTTYLMKKYYVCFLKTGPNRDHGEEEAARIQEEHLAHIGEMAADKKVCMAGPFESDGDIRGILVFSVSSMEEAEALAAADPAVKAGRLIMEFHPWWAAVGSQLY